MTHGKRVFLFGTPENRRTIVSASLTLAAAAAILAGGLDSWRKALYIRDTNGSATPTRAGVRFFHWQPVTDAPMPGGKKHWYLALRNVAATQLCQTVEEAIAASPSASDVAVLNVMYETPQDSVIACTVSSGTRNVVVPAFSRSVRQLGDGSRYILPMGFLLLDSTLHVVYGSRRPGEVKNVAAIIDLYVGAKVVTMHSER